MPTLKNIKSNPGGEWTPENADKLRKALLTLDIKEITTEKNGTFRVIMTTDKKDRDGEIIKIDGWNFENFMKNPVVLYGHNYWWLENIIGRVDKIYRTGNQWIAEGKFASQEANPKAQMVRRLYDEKIIQSVSVWFIIKGRDPTDDSIITSAELIELSFVPIPANPDAVDLIKALGGKEIASLVRKDTDQDTPTDDDKGDEDKGDEDKTDTEIEKTMKEVIEGLKTLGATVQTLVDGFNAMSEKKEKAFDVKEFIQKLNRETAEKLREMK